MQHSYGLSQYLAARILQFALVVKAFDIYSDINQSKAIDEGQDEDLKAEETSVLIER